jgi:hypothetical protein
MKSALILALSLAGAAIAADPKAVKETETRMQTDPAGVVKRLGSVTWDLESHKLVWIVQKGSMVNGEFVAASEERYAISPDQARMMVGEEERGFAGEEAVSLHRLLDALSLYCAESVVWWNQGQGAPVDKQPGNHNEKPKTNGDKPVKVDDRKPTYRVPSDQMVARAWY